MTTHPHNPEVFEKLRHIVYEHGMIDILSTLPLFFEAAYETHNLNTLENLLDARDSYWKGYQQYHESREQEEKIMELKKVGTAKLNIQSVKKLEYSSIGDEFEEGEEE